MGYHVTWVAVRGVGRAEVLRRAACRPTGVMVEHPEADAVATLPGGWHLLLREDRGGRSYIDAEGVLAELCRGADAVKFQCCDTVMVSSASGWQDGREVWSVEHDCRHGKEHLDAAGELPAGFVPLRDRRLEELGREGAGDCDFVYEVPCDLAAAVTGFNHNDGLAGGEWFEVIEPMEGPSLLRRLMRRLSPARSAP